MNLIACPNCGGPVEIKSTKCKQCGVRLSRGKIVSRTAYVFAYIFAVGMLLAISIVVITSSYRAYEVASAPQITTAVQNVVNKSPSDQVSIEEFEWNIGGLGTVALVSFRLKNTNSFSVKDPVVQCTFYGNSGTALGTQIKTIYETIPSKGSRKISDFSFGFIDSQSRKTSCSVLSVT